MRVGTRRAVNYAPVAAAGWWFVVGKTCVAAYQPKGAASQAASYVNLVAPGTHDATAPVAAPTWDVVTGWTFDGATTYLATDITVKDTSQDQCLVVRVASLGAANGYISATYISNGRMFGLFSEAASNRMQYMNGYGAVKTPLMTAGVVAVSGNDGYRNGASEGLSIVTWVSTNARPLFIGCCNINGTAGGFMAGDIVALAYYSNALTAGEVATVSAAMAAL